ncbi:MAG: hypothetical protein ACRELF_01350, partial [Gemmataceae bacterium]
LPTSRLTPAVRQTADLTAEEHPQKLLHLLDTRRGLVVLLLLAAGFGAVHALTPGHGKTLVAAYLVGEHGTVWHALLLGLMTTLTHTGAVFVLAIVFLISPSAANVIYYVQGLVGGLLIAALGLWLLLQRLFGRADHFHFGGHSHHHHSHDHAHEHAHPPSDGASVRWWHLVLLGCAADWCRAGMRSCYCAWRSRRGVCGWVCRCFWPSAPDWPACWSLSASASSGRATGPSRAGAGVSA